MVQPSPINVEFGRAVAKRREELGMTQTDLAGLTGMSRASIASIERGRQNVLLYHAYDLAEALEFRRVGDLLPTRPAPQRREVEVRVSSGTISDKDAARVLDVIDRLMPADEGGGRS